jgi:hypothetical protein
MVMGLVVDIWWLIFLAWRKGIFAGGFQEEGVQNVVFRW